MIFRRAKKEEYSFIIGMQSDIFHNEQDIPVEDIDVFLKRDPVFWCCEEEGKIIAAAAAWKEDGETHWGRFVVLPAMRKKHIGTKLAVYSFDDLFENGIDAIYMEARDTTVAIVCKMGGKIIGEAFPFYKGNVTPLILKKEDYKTSNGRKVKDITILSLSKGILGEAFVSHEVKIGLERLKEYGISVRFGKHALDGTDEIEKHPEKRAEDLLEAFRSDTDMILSAIGGEDTYRLLPYLFEHDELQNAVSDKIFLGFSDTTMNHFMLHKVGLKTFYGQAFLPDICEIGKEMLPYSRHYFEELIRTGSISEIRPSSFWYSSRESFGIEDVGKEMVRHDNSGFKLLQGAPVFSGEILGGCIDTIFDMFDGERFADSPVLCKRYDLFPSLSDWKGKILLLESSEEKASPEKYRRMIRTLASTGIFSVLNGVLIGKPADESHFAEYQQILKEEIREKDLSIVTDLNIGHANPRCILPFGVQTTVDVKNQVIHLK